MNTLNPWEALTRERKARRLADVVSAHYVKCGIVSSLHADVFAYADQSFFVVVAVLAGVRRPSRKTWERVATILTERQLLDLAVKNRDA